MNKSIAIMLTFVGTTVAANASMWNVVANMDMPQHGLSGPAVGQMTGTYDDLTNIWTVSSITATDLTGAPTNSHIHLGGVGINGPVIVPIGSSYSLSGNVWSYTGSTSLAVNQVDEAAFLSGGTYLNIHTGQFGGGEIRGQVIASAVPEPATLSLLAIGAAAAGLKRRKQRS